MSKCPHCGYEVIEPPDIVYRHIQTGSRIRVLGDDGTYVYLPSGARVEKLIFLQAWQLAPPKMSFDEGQER